MIRRFRSKRSHFRFLDRIDTDHNTSPQSALRPRNNGSAEAAGFSFNVFLTILVMVVIAGILMVKNH